MNVKCQLCGTTIDVLEPLGFYPDLPDGWAYVVGPGGLGMAYCRHCCEVIQFSSMSGRPQFFRDHSDNPDRLDEIEAAEKGGER